MYRYFAWTEKGKIRGQNLLSPNQIAKIKPELWNKYSVFASIGKYKVNHDIISCPLYIDFDGEKAFEDCKYAAYLIKDAMNLIPNVYFSGGKGFHIIIPYDIHHEWCHLMARSWAEMISPQLNIDTAVYSKRRLFKLNGSIGSNPKYFKIQLTDKELFSMSHEAICDLATKRRDLDVNYSDVSKIPEDIIDFFKTDYIKFVPKPRNTKEVKNDLKTEMPPCIEHILNHPFDSHCRNTSTFIIVRFLRQNNVSKDEASSLLFSHNNFNEFENDKEDRGSVSKVLNYIYDSGMDSGIGCRGNNIFAEHMRKYCNDLCGFNPNCPKFSDLIGE